MSDTRIKDTVKQKYGQTALRVLSGERGNCGCDSVSSNLYDPAETAALPEGAVLASLGCGNPTLLAELHEGETVLDLGSGGGIDVLLSARRVGPSGKAYGLDMTDEMLALARENQRTAGVTNVEFFKGEIEHIPLPDNSVDVILCSYMLHHLNLEYAYPEMHRILKPGGCVLACEALDYNPLIKLYRRLTPEMRTEWEKEHILSLKDVRAAKGFFNVGAIRYWHVFSFLGGFLRGAPGLFGEAMKILNAADRFLVRIPGVQLMAWQFSFELFKPLE